MSILVGTQRDTYCSDCQVDTTETVTYEGSEIMAELACCGTVQEYLPGDYADLICEG